MTNAGLDDVTEVNFFDQLRGDPGGIESMLQRDRAELRRGEGLKGTVERSHGSTRGSDDDDFGRGL